MKRQTKSAAALSLAVALALGAAPASFAAPGWRQDEKGTWTYYLDVSLMPNSSKTGGSGQSAKGPGGGEAGAQSEGEQTEEKGDGNQDGGEQTKGKGDETQEYTHVWKYFGKPEDGARYVNEGWFQAIPDGAQEDGAYENNGKGYYALSGQLCMNRFVTSGSATYAYDSEGKPLSGLKLIEVSPDDPEKIIQIFDPDIYTDRNLFIEFYNSVTAASQADGGTGTRYIYSFYFDENTGGAMKSGKVIIDLDGDEYTFLFSKSGPEKGRGFTGMIDNYIYLCGIRLVANRDLKYEVVIFFRDGTFQQYSFSDLIKALELEEDGQGYYYNNLRDGSFKNLLERKIGPVDSYYVINTSGTTKIRNVKTGDNKGASLNGAEITELYKQQ